MRCKLGHGKAVFVVIPTFKRAIACTCARQPAVDHEKLSTFNLKPIRILGSKRELAESLSKKTVDELKGRLDRLKRRKLDFADKICTRKGTPSQMS